MLSTKIDNSDIQVGDTVLNIYDFLNYYTNPYHYKNKVFFKKVLSERGNRFSVYEKEIPDGFVKLKMKQSISI